MCVVDDSSKTISCCSCHNLVPLDDFNDIMKYISKDDTNPITNKFMDAIKRAGSEVKKCFVNSEWMLFLKSRNKLLPVKTLYSFAEQICPYFFDNLPKLSKRISDKLAELN